TYRQARNTFSDVRVDVYHSRLRYRDRSRRHRDVIDRFKTPGAAAILVATQVAEMSLDLSADLLITDEAPVPALIQRMGRLNRRPKLKEPKPAVVVPIERGEEPPYDSDDLEMARTWRARLSKRGPALSQRDLAEEFAALGAGKDLALSDAEQNAYFF